MVNIEDGDSTETEWTDFDLGFFIGFSSSEDLDFEDRSYIFNLGIGRFPNQRGLVTKEGESWFEGGVWIWERHLI